MSSYCKNIATFTPFHWVILTSINLSFLKSGVFMTEYSFSAKRTKKNLISFSKYKEDNFTTKWYRVWMISIITFLITIWLGEGHTINEPWVPNYYHNHIWCPNLQKPDFCSFSLRDLHYFMRKFFI